MAYYEVRWFTALGAAGMIKRWKSPLSKAAEGFGVTNLL